jgi:DNA-binding PadR family transcriptional regulator
VKRQYIEQLKKGLTELALLYLISEVQTYGYNLIKELERRTTGYFRFKGGTIYPALRRLELKGLIKSRWQRTAQRHSRKYYQITEKGKQFLANRLADWRDFSAAVTMFIGVSDTGKAVSSKAA